MSKQKLIAEYAGRMKEVQHGIDVESNHSQADDLLCKLLCELGYADVVAEYLKVKKLYA